MSARAVLEISSGTQKLFGLGLVTPGLRQPAAGGEALDLRLVEPPLVFDLLEHLAELLDPRDRRRGGFGFPTSGGTDGSGKLNVDLAEREFSENAGMPHR